MRREVAQRGDEGKLERLALLIAAPGVASPAVPARALPGYGSIHEALASDLACSVAGSRRRPEIQRHAPLATARDRV